MYTQKTNHKYFFKTLKNEALFALGPVLHKQTFAKTQLQAKVTALDKCIFYSFSFLMTAVPNFKMTLV